MKKACFLFVAAALAALPTLAQNRAITFETGSFAEVLSRAKRENKPIMMDAYTTWCGPCKMMDKHVFTNDTIADYYNANFIAYKADMEKGEGPELAKRFHVQAYPNFIFIAPDGSVLHRSLGFRPVQEFLEVGKEALNPEKRYATLQKRYESGDRNPEFLAGFAAKKSNLALDNATELDAYFITQKDTDLTSRRNWNMLSTFAASSEAPAFKRFLKQRDAFNKTYTKDSVDQFIMEAYHRDFMQALHKGNLESIEKLKTGLAALQVKDSNKLLWQVDATGYQKKGDIPKYSAIIAKMVDTYYLTDPGTLNNYAWDFYENVTDKKMLAKAENWANKAVAMEPNYANLDTQAAVLYKLGKKKEAQKAAENAIAAGKKDGEEVAETEELLKKIKTLK